MEVIYVVVGILIGFAVSSIASMNASGYSTSEIAEALGISTSTVSNYLN